MSIGSLFAFMAYSIDVLNPISSILNIKQNIANIMPSYNRLMHFINSNHDEPMQKIVIGKDGDGNNRLEFKNVNLTLKGKKVLKNINFKFYSGDTILIKGCNGSGKTSLALLIQRLLKPDSGYILLNDKNINELDYDDYILNVAASNQDNYIFNCSIYDNIILGRNIRTEEILELEKKYYTNCNIYESVGINGGLLSGGQRQQIVIFRALLSNSFIYIFDEFDRNLDAKIKNDIFNFILEKTKNRIVFFISHDLFIEAKCNVVITFKNDGTFVFERKKKEYLCNE